MAIPTPPAAPNPLGTNFAAEALAFTQWMEAFANALPAEIDRWNAIGYGSFTATSTTSVTIGTGAKTLTVETGKGFVPGQALMVARTADPANYMTGQVTSYDAGTGALVLDAQSSAGSGTHTDWTVSVTAVVTGSTPIGTIATVANTAPTDGTWLACDGSVYLQSSYAALYAELGLIANKPAVVESWVNNAGVTTAMAGVCWSGTEFIAGGGSTILRLGADGTGNTAASHTGSNINAVVSDGAGLVLAPPYTGAATVRSTDGGATWAAGGSIVSWAGTYGAYGNSTFVFVGSAKCATTPDGVTYTTRTFVDSPVAISHAGGANFAAAVESGNVVLSADSGATWGSTVATGLTLVAGLAYGQGLLVAVGNVSSVFPTVAVSADAGATWRIVFIGMAGSASGLSSVAFGAGLFVATTDIKGQGLLWSPDGINWTYAASAAAIGGSTAITDYGGGRFVSVNNQTTNGAQRTLLQCITYNAATQFAVPQPSGQVGVKQFIKAL